jgi:hypothetical protein
MNFIMIRNTDTPNDFTGIKSLETVTLNEEDREVQRFFERLRDAKRLVIQDGTGRYLVEVKPAVISTKARSALTKGGPSDGS